MSRLDVMQGALTEAHPLARSLVLEELEKRIVLDCILAMHSIFGDLIP
jgi:hypothetical protein